MVGIYLYDRELRKYLGFEYLKCNINCRFLICKLICVHKLFGYLFLVLSTFSQLHRSIPGSRCHFQCVNEMMDPFLLRVYCKYSATLIFVLYRDQKPCVPMTYSNNFFTEPDFHQPFALHPFSYELLVRTPPCGRSSLEYMIQCKQALRFYDKTFKLSEK